ncbi:MAG: hypothetical protein CVT59_08505 [Actinobacteria bacterium HGW-Actinobacteria-1]|nr:MAG: hypothetical protein CVT59_08505 [Actinobacteria bacterium HGW-Actinobacteria-1]
MTESIESDQVARFRQEALITSGANWFFWVAILSVVNSTVYVLGAKYSMLVGLSSSLMAVAYLGAFGGVGKVFAMLAALVIAGIFALFGVFARKRQKWAFLVGLILYAIDGGIFLAFGDVLPALFHLVAMVAIVAGYRALRHIEAAGPAEEPPAMAGVAVGAGPRPSAPSASVESPLPGQDRKRGDSGAV